MANDSKAKREAELADQILNAGEDEKDAAAGDPEAELARQIVEAGETDNDDRAAAAELILGADA